MKTRVTRAVKKDTGGAGGHTGPYFSNLHIPPNASNPTIRVGVVGGCSRRNIPLRVIQPPRGLAHVEMDVRLELRCGGVQ